MDTRVGASVKQVTRKKTSPSTQRRNDRRRKHFLESKQTEAKSAGENDKISSCDVCDFSETSRNDLNIHMSRQQKDLEQLDGNIFMNSTIVDAQKQEVQNEDVLNLKSGPECWTWSRNEALPQKVHHPQEGLGSSPRPYTDALGFDQICYNFKTGVHDVFEIM